MKIRLATLQDAPALQRLYAQLNAEDPRADDLRFAELLVDILATPDHCLLVSELDGQVVCSCYLVIIQNLTRNLRPFALIENVVTESAFRNLGVGKAMIQQALNLAWKQDCYKVMLATSSKSEEVLNFYAGCGLDGHEKTAFVARH